MSEPPPSPAPTPHVARSQVDAAHAAAKDPASAALVGPYAHPWHPILVTVPIGAWISTVVLDIGSYVVDDGAFLARAATWLIAIGVLGALAAAAVGFVDLFGIAPGTPAFRVGLTHMGLVLLVTAAFVVNFLWRLPGDGGAEQVGAGPLLLSVAGVLVLAVAGSLGGRLAYRYGVRVAREEDQKPGFERKDT